MVIAQYVPKFISLSVELASVAGSGTQNILTIQRQIKELVGSAEISVKKHATKLNKFVAESKAKAKKSGTNITSCVSEEERGIQHIHMDVLEKCRLQDGVKHLYMFAVKLGKEEVSLSLTVKWCIIKHPLDGSELKICFDDKIEDVENKITEFQREMNTTLPEAMEYSNSCTKMYLQALNRAIGSVYGTFKECVDAVHSV